MYIRTRGCACVCVCVSVTVKSSCWAKMCNVASQAAITSSAPCLIYSQTLIRHMYINTLRCTSFIPCPHVHTNTFTIHLTATCSLCLSSHPHSLYPFYSQSHVQCCQALLGTVFVDVFVFFFLLIPILDTITDRLLVKPDKSGEFSHFKKHLAHFFSAVLSPFSLFTCHMTKTPWAAGVAGKRRQRSSWRQQGTHVWFESISSFCNNCRGC